MCTVLTQGDYLPHEDAVAPDVGLGREDGEVEALRRHPSRITGGWLRIYENTVNEDAFYTDLEKNQIRKEIK